MGKRLYQVGLLAAVFLLLSGCFFRSAEELYAVPKAPEDYENLQAKIDEVRSAGAEYAAPLTGNFTQNVQLRDLDGDGIQEAIAFFRVTTANNNAEGKPLKIYIYRQQAGGAFDVQAIIEGDGSAINSVAYEDLNGDGEQELIVSWQMSNKVYPLLGYAIHGSEVEQILYASYTDYAILDLDKDNQKEVVALNVNKVDAVYEAEFYDYDHEQGRMVMRDKAPMSWEATPIASTATRVGYLRDNEPALFVTSNISTGVITDIFAWRDDRLVNITLDEESGISDSTYRLDNSFGLRDINGDTTLELPRPMAFPDAKKAGGDVNFWSVQWVQYDIRGNAWPVYTTAYSVQDGWFLILPDGWAELIHPETEGQKVVLSRRDVVASGERAVVFSLWDGVEGSEPRAFLTICKLTGSNRVTRSKLNKRFVITQESDAIYAAEFTDIGWNCGLDEETLKERFQFIRPEWH